MATTTTSMEEAGRVVQRNRPGTSSALMHFWPAQQITEMDSMFAVQQFIQQQVRLNPTDVEGIVEPPEDQDQDVWQYEHLRLFVLELNLLVVMLDSVCTAASCPQMSATDEVLYLCAAHSAPQECPAIDYIVHTLDGAATLLTNTGYFPSRVSIPASGKKYFHNIARRLYRIFAHAYFHHQAVFDRFEASTHLCDRFVTFSKRFSLIPDKLLSIPPEAYTQQPAIVADI